MTEYYNTQIEFDTTPLLNEVNLVVQSGLNKLVNQFATQYKIYEETHNGVLNLPFVKKLTNFADATKRQNYMSVLDLHSETDSDSETELNLNMNTSNNLIEQKFQCFEQSILNSYQVFTSKTTGIMQQLALQIESLKNEMADLKQSIKTSHCVKPVIDLTMDEDDATADEESKELDVIIKQEPQLEPEPELEQEAKENIILEISEDTLSESNEEEEQDEEEEQEEDEEEDEEEQDEQDEEEPVEQVQETQPQQQPDTQKQTDDVETEAEEEEEEEEEEPIQSAVSKQQEDANEEEEELFEIEIEDVTYCTNDEENGFIYELTSEGDVGKKVGFLKDGEATFY